MKFKLFVHMEFLKNGILRAPPLKADQAEILGGKLTRHILNMDDLPGESAKAAFPELASFLDSSP